MRQIRIIIERRSNRFIATLAIHGGRRARNTYEEALARLRLSTGVRAECLSASLVPMRPPLLEACVAEAPNSGGFPG